MILPELQWVQKNCFGATRSHSDKEQIIRSILRKYPQWIRGHVLLGENALSAYEVTERSRSQRQLASVRVSAKALKALCQDAAQKKQLYSSYARYFDAMVAFYTKEYEDALSELEQMLSEKQLQQLSKHSVAQGIESAAAAALALGEHERAKQLFALLPKDLTSGRSETALAYIAESGEENQEKAGS